MTKTVYILCEPGDDYPTRVVHDDELPVVSAQQEAVVRDLATSGYIRAAKLVADLTVNEFNRLMDLAKNYASAAEAIEALGGSDEER